MGVTDMLNHLGQNSDSHKIIANGVDPKLLEAVPSEHEDLQVNLECLEFTSLCPVTGQPDFAKILIHYVINKHIV